MNSAASTSECTQSEPLLAMSLVCVGRDERGHRHIVHSHNGGIVAFLCGRWRPESKVLRLEGSRRHMHTCRTCSTTWERTRKEQAT